MSTAVVTGAAAGIGRATARRLHEAGWQLSALDRDRDGLASLQAELGEERLAVFVCDVADSRTVGEAFAAHAARWGQALELLVNNAGVLETGAFEQIPLSAHERIITVNATGMLAVLHAAFPLLRRGRDPRVVNLSSASAVFGVPEFASYSASKFFVRGLTEALSVEWRRQGIHVCQVLPAFVATDMVHGRHSESMRRLGVRLTADEVAATILKAATGRRRLSWPVGGGFRILRILLGPSPEWLKRRVMGWITGY